MAGNPNTFAELFKKYRLKAEIPTLSKFGHLLAEKGFNYEDSIFSHWQNGSRIPQYRNILIKLLEIFNERGAITSSLEANQFLASVNQGYLTSEETKGFNFKTNITAPINLPVQVSDFSGREVLIEKAERLILKKNIVLLYGSPGVGKTVLALQLAYNLKNKFPDGLLWYRLDTSDVMDILLSIAHSFGVNVGHIQDREIRAATIRSLLAGKKALLIFDNAEVGNEYRLLLQNSSNTHIILTSRFAQLPIPADYESVLVDSFTKDESLSLFEKIMGEEYAVLKKSKIIKLAEMTGSLPLVLHIFANEIKKENLDIEELVERVENDSISLKELTYENRNLLVALDVSLSLLDELAKKVFISTGIFEGKDFSVEAIAFINGLSPDKAHITMKSLVAVSLIEKSTEGRFRTHPVIKKFVRRKIEDEDYYLKASKYYQSYLSRFDKTRLKSSPNIKQESNNVLYIFKKCYELQYWDEVIDLWSPLEDLLFATNQLSKTEYLFLIAKNQNNGLNIFQKLLLTYLSILIIYWIYLQASNIKFGVMNDLYSLALTVFPVSGGIGGLFIAKSWGLLKSSLGKSILFLSLGLVSWGSGNIVWSYYNFFLNEAVPYPSLADVGFLPSYLLWTIGVIHLPHAIGGKSNFKKKYKKVFYFIPVFVFALSYILVAFISKNPLLFVGNSSYLKLFFDIAYPIADVVILTSALLVGISFKFFGGKYKTSIYNLIVGFCFLYIGDFLFSYTTTAGTYYNGGIVDISFVLGFFFLSFGLFGFYLSKEKEKV